MFKSDWEKVDLAYCPDRDTIVSMVSQAYPAKEIEHNENVSNGCANINIKINFKNESASLLLRIYVRDIEAAARERNLASLIGKKIPVSEVYYTGDFDNYKYALCKYLPGVPLRDILLSAQPSHIFDIMYEAGGKLAQIAKIKLPSAGFFDENLGISKPINTQEYLSFLDGLLQDTAVCQGLGEHTTAVINAHFSQLKDLLPNEEGHNLVHGDFDPANILVVNAGNDLHISGIIDWEFAFSGSSLHDVANMLRYAHKMPDEYKKGFIDSLTDSGMTLPDGWHITIILLNLLSLLDCLKRTQPAKQSQRTEDILSLINYNLSVLDEVYK